MDWTTLGVLLGLGLPALVIFFLVMRALMIYELRRAFRPIRQDLDELAVQVDQLAVQVGMVRGRLDRQVRAQDGSDTTSPPAGAAGPDGRERP
jgi:membrane protein implicated in regulation of membrane protease activity